ncbi:MAG TPA: DNA polymerase III subunit delta [Acidimicrobiales bacterium]|nr:DNA polymerase III subunit delta [Acidimicrobiales bacterium]
MSAARAARSATASGAPKPVYLVRGDDPTLLSDAVRELLGELVGDDDHSLAVEDITLQQGDEQRVAALLDACLTPPFLTDRRIVVARNAGLLTADEGARLLEYLSQPLDTTVLVLVGGGGTIPAKLVAAIKQQGEQVDAGLPRQAKERTSWIVDRLKASPLQFDAPAGARLSDHLGEDVARLGGIIDTLVSAYGEGTRIGVEELEPFLGTAGSVALWDLTDAVDKGDQALALQHLHRMMAGGERHPLVVMATLHRHFQQMLRLDGAGVRSDAEAAQVLGLKGSTFPAKKALSSARRLGSGRIRRAIELLAEADLDLRGAKGWPEPLVMEVLVARLCQLSRR